MRNQTLPINIFDLTLFVLRHDDDFLILCYPGLDTEFQSSRPLRTQEKEFDSNPHRFYDDDGEMMRFFFFPGYPKPLASIFSIAIIHHLLMVDLAKKNKRALFLIRINKPNNKKQIKIHPPKKWEM